METCEKGIELAENVEVDETLVGGREEGKRGRSKGNKSLDLASVEVNYDDTTRKKGRLKGCRAAVIEDAFGEALTHVLDETIEATAIVTTGGWKRFLGSRVDEERRSQCSGSQHRLQLGHQSLQILTTKVTTPKSTQLQRMVA